MSTATTQEASFTSADGLRLHERAWLPEGEPRAVLAVVPGAAEHSGRYAHLGGFLARHGYAVHALDLRGHGESAGRRLFVRSFGEYLDDVGGFLARVRLAHPGKPLFLLGHSMGGTVAALYALTRPGPLRGLVLSGPLLALGDDLSPLKAALARFLGRFLPRLPVQKLDAASISRDPEVVRRYREDPRVHHGAIPAGTAAAGMAAIARIEETEPTLEMPLLILHGTADRLASPAGSQRLQRRAGSADRTLRLYDGYFHEVFNEPGRERVLDDLLAWLDAHAEAPAERAR